MRELDECLRITRMIAETKEKIEELEMAVMSPRSQAISDMPKGGGGTINAIESYILKKEKLEGQIDSLQEERAVEWCKVCGYLEMFNQKKTTKTMLWLRFCKGYSWNKCVSKLSEAYPDERWSANKCFRIYRDFLHKVNSKSL